MYLDILLKIAQGIQAFFLVIERFLTKWYNKSVTRFILTQYGKICRSPHFIFDHIWLNDDFFKNVNEAGKIKREIPLDMCCKIQLEFTSLEVWNLNYIYLILL